MGIKESLKIGEIPRFLISGLAIIFILSLSLHNHSFYYGTSLTKVYQPESSYPRHSKDFCSACRLDGDIKPQGAGDSLGFSSLGTLVDHLNLDVLIPSSFLTQNKPSRSPPIV
ncbi:MAG TPA: hypothetical protein VLB01_02575 [Thermodesulfobacteriota bacterium]|nr:hypothetical protein [Thermodesulfobacteriota bacterium]